MTEVFVPFMLGTISLIIFFNQRNNYLGTRLRDICDKFRYPDDGKPQELPAGTAPQLLALMTRYKKGTEALRIAVLAVTSFGTMLMAYFILDPEFIFNPDLYKIEGSKRKVLELVRTLSVALFAIIGGGLATWAASFSIFEISNSRRSLWTHVAQSILSCESPKDKERLNSLRDQLTSIQIELKEHISTSLYNDFDGLTDELKRTTRSQKSNKPE